MHWTTREIIDLLKLRFRQWYYSQEFCQTCHRLIPKRKIKRAYNKDHWYWRFDSARCAERFRERYRGTPDEVLHIKPDKYNAERHAFERMWLGLDVKLDEYTKTHTQIDKESK